MGKSLRGESQIMKCKDQRKVGDTTRESRIDDDGVLNVIGLDSRFNAKKVKEAARQGFLPPDFSSASRLDVLPLGWIGLADLVDLHIRRSSLLSRDALPDVKDAFAIDSREESHKALPLLLLVLCLRLNESGSLYLFDEPSNQNLVNHSDVTAYVSKTLWHSILGHPADQVFGVSLQKELHVSKQLHVSPCDICHRAKQTRDHFPFSDHKTSTINDLIQLDLWGPYKVPSGEGFRYFLIVVDDYSRGVWDVSSTVQIQDYALWEVIENGDSWVSVSQTSQENGITVTKMSTPATAKEKINKKNDVKARGLLLMALPNEHQLTFKISVPTMESPLDSIFNSLEDSQSGMLILGSLSSTNDANTACPQVSAASPSVNTASPQVCTASVCDNTVYAFMVENSNGSNVLHQDLEQIHDDDFKAMDLKHQEERKVSSEIKTTPGSKETMKTLQRQCWLLMLGVKGFFDGSDMAEEQVQTNMALMAFSDSEESPITDKSKKGLGYSAVPLPHPLIYNRPNKLDLSYSGLDEFKEPEFKGYGLENSKQESNVVCETESDNSKENSDKSLLKEQSKPKSEKKTVIPTAAKKEFAKHENHEKPFKKSVRQAQHDDKGFVDRGAYGGKITGKGTLKTDNLDFEDVYFCQ
ncbi:ribonuclease H-like domain-containing protein [Tanacetum coccineum]